MERELMRILKEQSHILFANIDITLDKVDAAWLTSPGFRWLPWKQLYHMIHSLDQWFINPAVYNQPSFHTPGMNSPLEQEEDIPLSKEEFRAYYAKVRQKVTAYLDSFDPADLVKKPEACEHTRFALILGQFRHLMYHLGFLHCCMNRDYEKLPGVKGLGPPMEPVKGKE